MSEQSAFERLLQRERLITIVGLATLCMLAWLYIVMGAGLGMTAWETTRLALFPHEMAAVTPPATMSGMNMDAPAPRPGAWDPAEWALIIAMWWIMMIAMMVPSAAPTILLYGRVHRHALSQGSAPDRLGPTFVFAAGYFLIWLGFAILAAALYWILERSGAVSAALMGSRIRWLSGGVLIAAGIFQLSPLKHVCLVHCRAPAAFLTRHWRPGTLGALRLGAMHGGFCLGCCWLLMALLFVGGVMNLAWIAALAFLVLAEKTLPFGQWVARGAGATLIIWGVATFLA
jgi:predicted metal-binding membrane protein